LHQIRPQGDSLDRDRSEQTPNRRVCFASANCHEDVVVFSSAQVWLDGFSERPCQVGFVHEFRHIHHPPVFRSGPWAVRSSISTVMSATNLYEFPWAGQVRATLIRLDLDQHSANIRDGADVHALAHPVAYLESHFHTSAAAKPSPLRELSAVCTSRPLPSVVESGNDQLAARMPAEFALPAAPIDSVPDRVCIDDDSDTAPVAGS
jgi:hypothetical protein